MELESRALRYLSVDANRIVTLFSCHAVLGKFAMTERSGIVRIGFVGSNYPFYDASRPNRTRDAEDEWLVEVMDALRRAQVLDDLIR
ncbi:MAG: hypothetical protein AB7L09_01660 [Nitrospira sp.]